MPDLKISQMTDAALPLTGAELVPIVQAGNNRKVISGYLNGSRVTTTTVTTNTTLSDQDLFVYVSGVVTITLPTAVGRVGKLYYIKNTGTDAITINTTGGETIDGETSFELAFQNSLIGLVSNGANWFIF